MSNTVSAESAAKRAAQTVTAPGVTSEIKLPSKYVRGERLLEELFDPESRPSIRWLRTMTAARKLPFVKLGGKVLFDIGQVRAVLQAQPTAKAR